MIRSRLLSGSLDCTTIGRSGEHDARLAFRIRLVLVANIGAARQRCLASSGLLIAIPLDRFARRKTERFLFTIQVGFQASLASPINGTALALP